MQGVSRSYFLYESGKTMELCLMSRFDPKNMTPRTKHVPASVRKKYASIEWKRIAGMRDILIDEYYGKLDLTKITLNGKL